MINKYLFSLFIFIFPAAGFSQITKTAAIPYTTGTPTHTPSASGSAWAIDNSTLDLWVYYGGAWNLAGERIQTISGCAAPAYTPGTGQSLFVVNGCDSLYYYRSGAWRHANKYTAPDGNGIYSGDGTIQSVTTATLQTNGAMLFNYSNNNEGIVLNDFNASARMNSRTSTSFVEVSNNKVTIGANGPVEIINGGGTSALRIREPNNGAEYTELTTGAQSANISYRLPVTNGTNGQFLQFTTGGNLQWAAASGGGGVTDGDKGDIDVTGSGTVWTVDTAAIVTVDIADNAVTYAKLQDVAANSVLARVGTTSGDASAVGLSASNLLGRGSTGDVAPITLGANLSMTGTALNTTGHPTITGTPTTNAIPKWTSSSALGSTIMQESISGTDTIIQIVGRDALRLPLGTTAERPGTPTIGMTRYNTTNGAFEYYDADAWETPLLSATGTGLGTAGNVFFADENGKAGGVSALQYNTTHNNLINAASGLSETINSQYKFSMQNNGNVILYGEANGDAADTRCQYSLTRTRGTQASKTAVLNGDIIARHSFGAWNGSGFNYPAAIEAYVDGAVNSGGVVETSFSFATSITGVSRTRRLTVKPNGNIGIGTETPANRLQISGTLGRNAPVSTDATSYVMTNDVNTTWLICDETATTTITLPAASSWSGRELTIKNITAFAVNSNASNVLPIGSNTAGTAILSATAGSWALLVSNGSNWVIMQRG